MISRTNARLLMLAAVLALAIALVGASATPALAKGKKRHGRKNIKIIKKVAKEHGLPAADVKALVVLAKRESGYNARCKTGSYRGLFQIKETKANRKHWADPEFNTRVAIKQIKHRYKTPRAALAHSYRYGWY